MELVLIFPDSRATTLRSPHGRRSGRPATLSYSRRVFVKAFLGERTAEWLDGIAAAFRRFGGTTQVLLRDRARCLVASADRAIGAARFTPALLQFCRDWSVTPRACAPYRVRTKGKVESRVKYVKRNALAGRQFASFAALECTSGSCHEGNVAPRRGGQP